MQIRQKYLNDLLCISAFFVYNILKLLTYYTPFYGYIAFYTSLSYQRSNRSGFFWLTLYTVSGKKLTP